MQLYNCYISLRWVFNA